MKLNRALAAGVAGLAVLGLAACGGGNGGGGTPAAGGDGTTIQVLIGTSGDAETASVQAAADAWKAKTGNTANIVIASDLVQQISQGFAAGSPADVFYLPSEQFAGWAKAGNLFAYGDKIDAQFSAPLMEQFTYDGTFYAAPKDFSTLALAINTDMWEAAGLTDADIPTTWDELKAVAQKLTTADTVGLSFGPEWQRIGTFMAQAGGGMLDADHKPALDTDANKQALTFVQDLMKAGYVKYPSEINAGWGGEAFGTQAAAMTIEGNWLMGAMSANYPDVNFKIVELPAGPNGDKGTLQFTTAWGIAAASQNQDLAVDFVKFMTSDEQQMQFARDFGVMPSVTTVADQWASEFPEQAAFIAGAPYAQGIPAIDGITQVLSDFNSQLETLSTANVAQILSSVQATLKSIAG